MRRKKKKTACLSFISRFCFSFRLYVSYFMPLSQDKHTAREKHDPAGHLMCRPPQDSSSLSLSPSRLLENKLKHVMSRLHGSEHENEECSSLFFFFWHHLDRESEFLLRCSGLISLSRQLLYTLILIYVITIAFGSCCGIRAQQQQEQGTSCCILCLKEGCN